MEENALYSERGLRDNLELIPLRQKTIAEEPETSILRQNSRYDPRFHYDSRIYPRLPAEGVSPSNYRRFNSTERDQLTFQTDVGSPVEKRRQSPRKLRLIIEPTVVNETNTGNGRLLNENERLIPNSIQSVPEAQWNGGTPGTAGTDRTDSLYGSSRRSGNSQQRRFPKRAVLKNGECNVLKKTTLSKSRLMFLKDIFTTLVDVSWRYTLIAFALSFLGSWLFFAGVYMLIGYAHGDFETEHMEDADWTPCVANLKNFASVFLFSVETQHTIGYGGRSTNEECPEAIFIMCMQSIGGVMISAMMAGVFFAKVSRPKQRRQTLLFSRKAVVCQRDGQLCLMFRVGDVRKSHIIVSDLRAHIFQTRITREGEELHQYQRDITVNADGCESSFLFIWPLTIVHVINKDSPFYGLSAQELMSEKFEIVVLLEGTVESTGQSTQARTSYLPKEIKWGHRFEPIVSYSDEKQSYEVDYKKFNETTEIDTPLCSAKDLDYLEHLIHGDSNQPQINCMDVDHCERA